MSIARRFLTLAVVCTAIASAVAQDNPPRTALELFRAGLQAQKSAAAMAAPNDALTAAAKDYESALALQPDYGPALNNLAQIYGKLGQEDLARQTFHRAIKAGGAKQAFYTANFADFLTTQGGRADIARACDLYAEAAVAQPDNDALHQKLVDTCLSWSPKELTRYFWDLLSRGQVLQTQKYALRVLLDPSGLSVPKNELLAILAVCLSRQAYDPANYGQTVIGAKLATNHDAMIAEAIAALVKLHQPQTEDPTSPSYAWWRNEGNPFEPAPHGLWPREAFQKLALALGDRYRAADPKRAEAYYQLAAFLRPEIPEPDALTRLAELYIESDKLDSLSQVMRAHEQEIFNGKAMAIRQVQWDKIYRFHSALGMIYSAMGRWGDSNDPHSAIYQLEHALNAEARRPPGSNVFQELPAGQKTGSSVRLVSLLADSYAKTSRASDAVRLLEVKGKEYQRLGDPGALRSTNGFKEEIQRTYLRPSPPVGLVQPGPVNGLSPADETAVLGLNDALERYRAAPNKSNQMKLTQARDDAAKLGLDVVQVDEKSGTLQVKKDGREFSVPKKIDTQKLKAAAQTKQ